VNASPAACEWLVWQLADSAFPMGAFAHSGGLEAARQQGEVGSRDLLTEFIRASLAQTARGALPFVARAHDCPGDQPELDAACEAFLSNHVANRASRLQGQALLASAERSFSHPGIAGLRRSGIENGLPCHFAPVFGVVLRWLGVSRDVSIRLFLFLALRGGVSSAVRLGMIGPLEGQAVQFQLAPFAEDLSQRFANVEPAGIVQTAPVLDILQGAQDRLYSRLFQT
jgi:urease accessory protein